jgi:iron complex outermembrane receptor protein
MRAPLYPKPLTLALLLALNTAWAAPTPDPEPDPEPRREAPSDDRVKELGTVKVRGVQPTSLPTQIPTTMAGITRVEIDEQINATDSSDALKYLPSLLVRKRYIGDYDHAVLATRASGTGNSARSLVYADGILLSNLLGNGAQFTPRWGLVTPEEIERVDVLYGPFSAAYAGNSVGAVVDYVTRMPERFEATARAGGSLQRFSLYGVSDTYSAHQFSAGIGNRVGPWSFRLNAAQQRSDSHPLVFPNRLVSAGTTGTGTAVTGAVADNDPRGRPWWILGATNLIDTQQTNARLKLAYDFNDDLRLSLLLGWWDNDVVRSTESYLRDSTQQPVYNGPVLIEGRRFALTPADFAPNRAELQHAIQGLTLKQSTGDTFDYQLSFSHYDYVRDRVRSPLVARPAAESGGAGRIARLDGTGWITLSAAGTWRPGGAGSAHTVEFGLQRDRARLKSEVFDTADWLTGGIGARFSAFGGRTTLTSAYLQDTWRVTPVVTATVGARVERWEADEGLLGNAARVTRFPERSETTVSPKAALAYAVAEDWSLQGSVGRSVRNPTVSELFQGSLTTDAVVNNDPNLAPERGWTAEFSSRHQYANGDWRATVFYERTTDALFSQTNVTVTPNVTNIQNVDRIVTHGLELAFNHYELGGWPVDLTGSVTFADSEIEQNRRFPASVGKQQPRVPRWRANLLTTWRPSDALSVTVGGRYSGRQFGTLDNVDTNQDTYTAFSQFLVFDARVLYRYSEQFSAAVGVDNIGGDRYWAFHPYPQRTVSVELIANY